MSSFKKKLLDQSLESAIDMYQKDGNIIIAMHISGINPDSLHVEIEDGQLHVFGEHLLYLSEEHGIFDRLISLPSDINKSAMTYELSDDHLVIVIPKNNMN